MPVYGDGLYGAGFYGYGETTGAVTIENVAASVGLACVSAVSELATDGASVSLSDSLLGQ